MRRSHVEGSRVLELLAETPGTEVVDVLGEACGAGAHKLAKPESPAGAPNDRMNWRVFYDY